MEGSELEELFRPDVIMPSQWADEHRQSRAKEGIHKLALAVLEDAVTVIVKHGNGAKVKPRQVISDLYWIFSRREGAFTMLGCCYLLEIEPEVIRRGMTEFIESRRDRFEPLGW